MKPLNIVVMGAGMYVCGRGTEGYGTIMPAIIEWQKNNKIGEVSIVGKRPANINAGRVKISRLSKNMRARVKIRYFAQPEEGDTAYYKKIIKNIDKPACAIVAVPDNMHREIAGASIEAGLHTLVVKPLVPTVKDVKRLINIQNQNKVYCAVEFHKRLDHANLKLRDVIGQGMIGDPLYFLVEYSQRKSIPSERFKKWVNATNVFQYLGIHYVDIIYFATGAKPLRAMAIGQKCWLASRGINNYDSIEAVIEWRMPSGKTFGSHILTNWIDPEKSSAMSDQKIKVIGTKGRFESDQKRRGITIVTDDKGIEEPNPYFCFEYGGKRNISYAGYGIESIHQFLNDVVKIEQGVLTAEDLEPERPTFQQSIVPTAVLEAVNRSLRSGGKWMSLE